MSRDQVLATLKAHEAALRRQGVTRAALFGSLARGDAGAGSDVDIMVELDPAARVTLWDYIGLQRALQALFPVKVDVVSRAALNPYIRQKVESDALYAF